MSRQHLFSKSLHDRHSQSVRAAEQKVERLDRRVLTDPALSGRLEKIAGKYDLDVAKLSDKLSGAKGRTIERMIDDYDRTMKQIPVLDVSIPFSGDPASFEIGPSTGTLCRPRNTE